jgi:hypothetical protein
MRNAPKKAALSPESIAAEISSLSGLPLEDLITEFRREVPRQPSPQDRVNLPRPRHLFNPKA